MPRCRHGYTLIELLITLAIITLLAAILFPVLSAARTAAYRATCASNLRQIGLAMTLYLEDHEERFPCTGDANLWMGRQWRPVLEAYLRRPSIFWCPRDLAAQQRYDSTSYAYLQGFYHDPACFLPGSTQVGAARTCIGPIRAQRLDAVEYPDRKILVYEWTTNHEAPTRTMWDSTGAHHALCVDGHVAAIRQEHLNLSALGDRDPNWTVRGIAGQDF